MKKRKDVVRVDWQQFSQEEQASYKQLVEAEKHFRPAVSWSQVDLEFMKRFYGKVPVKMLGAKLHRSVSSLHQKANELGVMSGKKRVREK